MAHTLIHTAVDTSYMDVTSPHIKAQESMNTQLAYLSVMDVSWQNNLVKGKIDLTVRLKMIKCCKICLN